MDQGAALLEISPIDLLTMEYVPLFLAACGSTLTFRDTRHPDSRTLTIASLDDPNWVEPTYHIYTDSQVTWLKIDDECKRFAVGPEKADA